MCVEYTVQIISPQIHIIFAIFKYNTKYLLLYLYYICNIWNFFLIYNMTDHASKFSKKPAHLPDTTGVDISFTPVTEPATSD